MGNRYENLNLLSESDVEQKFIVNLLTFEEPEGLGFSSSDYKTKVDIRKITIDKGTKKKLYYPDYAIVMDGLPLMIIEAKAPGEDLEEAIREARLYATEINSNYSNGVNPCSIIVVTDGVKLSACYWDEDAPFSSLTISDLDITNPIFAGLTSKISKVALKETAASVLSSIRTSAHYVKPIFMLGGKTVINEIVGDNSFGANVSVEYKYLFNPDSLDDRASIIKNAYVPSRRKQAHVAPIEKIIRAALPPHVVDAREINDSGKPIEIHEVVANSSRIKNEICLLIGSVGSGKSTFTDYLRLQALSGEVVSNTEWINLNLNKAPLSRDLIYKWILEKAMGAIQEKFSHIDFNEISTLKKIYASQLAKVEKGKAALYPKDSEKYVDIIFNEIDRLQNDDTATFAGIINFLYPSSKKVLVIVLDNCDKRNRDDQLLMFEVAAWLKNQFPVMVFLPLRDTTYDQFRSEPPLDTVIKDLVFRIDPPLLEKVIYARLNYALREIGSQRNKFAYHLPNGIKVECSRSQVGDYLKSMVSSLFQDQLFKRIITGLAGRNIRRGLEILLDFCKSGHIGEDEILRIKTSNGEYKLPNHIITKILLKGKRRYYSDQESNIKNLFHSDSSDSLPDPFARISILQWLSDNKKIAGPNRVIGFHKVNYVIGVLQGLGHSSTRLLQEIDNLTRSGCILAENQYVDISPDDLISLAPAGYIHLDLLRNINYLSTVSEDTLFRENQPARAIADNLIGKGSFRSDSRQSAISNSKILSDYMSSYKSRFFVGAANVIPEENRLNLLNLENLEEFVSNIAENDDHFRNVSRRDAEYPPGKIVEAQVVSIQSYGFFVEFGLDGNGLIHNSQIISPKTLDDFEAGDWVSVEIIGYNTTHRKFDLKLIKDSLIISPGK